MTKTKIIDKVEAENVLAGIDIHEEPTLDNMQQPVFDCDHAFNEKANDAPCIHCGTKMNEIK